MTFRILLGIFLLFVFRLLAILIIPPNGDEVLYLYMADDIAHGAHFPLYTYEQQVLGTLNSWSIAPLFKLFGFTFLGARLWYGLFYFAFAGIYLWIVQRLFNRALAAYQLILLSILPFPLLFFTTVPCWMDVPFLAIVSLFLLILLADEGCKNSGWLSWALGFVGGLGIWCNPLFIIWLVPIGISGIWLIPQKGKIKLEIIFLLGFLAGLFPVWVHGLQTGTLMSLDRKGGAGFVSLANFPLILYFFFARMKYFLSTFSFGPVSPWVDRLIRGLSFIPLVIFLTSFGSLVFYFLRSFKGLKPSHKVFYTFMIIPPLVFMALYTSRDFSATRDEGMRFFVQLMIPYVFAISWQLERMGSAFLKNSLLGLLIGIVLLGYGFSGRELFQRKSRLSEVAYFLEKEGLRFGIADMGIAYPLNALSGHHTLTTPLPHHAPARSIWEKVKAAGPRYLILEHDNPQLRNELENDPKLKKQAVGPYDVFYGDSDYLASILDVQEPILG